MYSGDESMNLVTGDEVDKPGDVVIQLSYVSFLSVLDGLLGTSIKRTEFHWMSPLPAYRRGQIHGSALDNEHSSNSCTWKLAGRSSL